jgi:hypothetical protein
VCRDADWVILNTFGQDRGRAEFFVSMTAHACVGGLSAAHGFGLKGEADAVNLGAVWPQGTAKLNDLDDDAAGEGELCHTGYSFRKMIGLSGNS